MTGPIGVIDTDRLRAALVASSSPWAAVEHHASLGSTNARAAEVGRPWHVVVADHQTAGRGRLQRRWDSPAGSSLLVSATVPLPPPSREARSDAGWVPLLTGVAVLRAVETATGPTGPTGQRGQRGQPGLRATLKWPNDVLLPADGSRKVCGILCEVVTGGPGALVVIGIGLNITQSREELPVPTATSLLLAGATDVDPTSLAVSFLEQLARLYAGLVAGAAEMAAVRAAYRDRCATLGQEVRLSRTGADDVVGRAVAVDDDGRLVIEAGDGRTAWAAGDVVHLRPADAGPWPPPE
ncbi:MAG: biotin--[acetyl-CoA-carboxylase] ligase [Lapillicoccus sp.]